MNEVTAAPMPTGIPAERLWNVHDVAAYLGVPVATLYRWRYLGRGPNAYRVGRHLRYHPDEVARWATARPA